MKKSFNSKDALINVYNEAMRGGSSVDRLTVALDALVLLEEYDLMRYEIMEEYYQTLKAQEKKIEDRLYAEYDGRLAEVKEYIVDKVDDFCTKLQLCEACRQSLMEGARKIVAETPESV